MNNIDDDLARLLNLKISFKVKPYRFNPSENISYRVISMIFLIHHLFRSGKTNSIGICVADTIIDNKLEIIDLVRAIEDPLYKLPTSGLFSSKAFKILSYMIGYGLIETSSLDTYSLSDKAYLYMKRIEKREEAIHSLFSNVVINKKITIKMLKTLMEK